MNNYTYKFPDKNTFWEGIKTLALTYQESIADRRLFADILENSCCEFVDTGDYSTSQWNVVRANIIVYISLEKYGKYAKNIQSIEDKLQKICEKLLPVNSGYEVNIVSISPVLEVSQNDTIKTMSEDLFSNKYPSLDEDIIKKGKIMAEAYAILYALENFLRDFIHRRLMATKGKEYSNTFSAKTRGAINSRKEQEKTKKWLPIRGENDLYYLDFIELSNVIINNWDDFKDIISDQLWIKVKIEELYNIRCLIAHNSYISNDTIDLLNATAKQIFTQLS